jgi:thimet oligopeptidase
VLRVAAAIVFLFVLSADPIGSAPRQSAPRQAAQPQQPSTTPFTTGITNAASLTRGVDARIARARTLLDSMLAVTGARTVANTLAPYDELLDELNTASGQVSVMMDLHPDAAVRQTAEELDRAVSAMLDEIPLRTDVHAALKAIDLRRADAATRYYVTRELRNFGRAGVDQPEAARAQLKVLRDQLTQAMAEFARNIRDGSRTVTGFKAADLDGLPADFIARHPADASGAVTLSTSAVDARPVLIYAKNDELRRQMLVATYNVAAPDNVAVLDRILRVRADIARLLGYRNWAAYDTEVRMAGDEKAVSAFIDRVVAAARPRATRELAELASRKAQDRPGSTLQPWDRLYYSELVRRSSYDFDSQVVRPYFAFERVLAGVLRVTGTIFGLTYQQVTDVPVWHPSVRVYEMRDGNTLVGRLYLDLHPRANKTSSGATTLTVSAGREGQSIPEVVMSASLPGDQPNDPGLMSHEEVRTVFHEFGHVVHRLSGGHQRWQGLSSLAMERDFTEAPSQMLEEWVWDPKTLATFATHYQTGQPIPAALVQQMRRASEFGQGIEVAQQMVLARVSLSLHDRDPRSIDQAALWKETQARTVDIPFIDGTARQASFPHIGQAGYASAYYTYMWSLVIGKDLFSRFEGRDLTAPGIARKYRETIFLPGSSKTATAVVTEFLGRPFNSDAWGRWLNGLPR